MKAPPPRVTVAAAGSRLATVIEVRAQDAPGLLHRIGRALEQSAVRVRSAHVSTLGANAVDAFYVTGAEGSRCPTHAQQSWPERSSGLWADSRDHAEGPSSVTRNGRGLCVSRRPDTLGDD